MKMDDALLSHLESLSYLRLQPDEKEAFKNDLSAILRFMETLDQLDVASIHGSESMPQPCPHTNAFRDDIVTSSADRAAILSNAADHADEYFKSHLTVKPGTK